MMKIAPLTGNGLNHLLAYDNGMLPLALLHSAEILKDNKITGPHSKP